MYIRTESTPNPQSLKFILDDVVVSGSENLEFKNKDDAKLKSDLAYELLGVKGVSSIFLGSDFITVTKSEESEWSDIKSDIISKTTDFFVAGKNAVKEGGATKDNAIEGEDEISKQIREIIDIKVRPAVAMDGGDVIYRGFNDGIVLLELRGACSGCPSSTITLKNGIENMLKHHVPEVVAVEQVFED